MGLLIPIAWATQWICGLVVSVVELRETPRYGRTGQGPRAVAAVAVLLFALAAAELLLALLAAWTGLPWLPRDLLSSRWQVVILLVISAGAWLALLIAAAWRGLLGATTRRRLSAEEIERRTEQALGPRETP